MTRRAKPTTCPCGKQIKRKCIYPPGNKKGPQRCKACRRASEKERLRVYYQANKESLLPRLRAYQREHPEIQRKARKRWRENHPEHARKLNKIACKRYKQRKTMLKRLGFTQKDGVWVLPEAA